MSKINQIAKISYLLDYFPTISETFVLNEILELKNHNININLISIFNPVQKIMHQESIELAKETFYLRKFNNLFDFLIKIISIIYANLFYLAIYTNTYLKTLWFICKLKNYKTFIRLFIAAYLALMLQRLKIRHIHTHFAHVASEYAMLIYKLSGIPYSFTVHAFDIFIDPKLLSEKINHAAFIISKTVYNKKFIQNKYSNIDENKIKLIHYGIDLEKFSPTEKESRDKDNLTILCIGRLVEKKGHRYLIEACNILKGRGVNNIRCIIIGSGPLVSELEMLVHSLFLCGIIQFVEEIPNDKIRIFLNKSDLFVLPCIVAKNGDMDGMPNVLIEAMALSKPVISTYISGIPELVKDGSGILVPPNNSKSLANAIENFYNMNSNDRILMGQRGRKIVEKEFNIKTEVNKITTFLTPISTES